MQTIALSEDKREVTMIVTASETAFEMLQNKFAVMRKQHGIVSTQLSLAEMEKKRNRLTVSELDKLPDGTATYKAVGKMFLLVPSSDIHAECKKAAEVAEERLAEYSSQKAALEKNMSEVEASRNQLLQAAREQ